MLTGNREFNEIYEKYKNLVLKVAYIYSGNNYDVAEDITQDTFLKLYTGFEDFKREKTASWLYTVAKNAAINYRKKNEGMVSIDDEDNGLNNTLSTESIEDSYLEREHAADTEELHDRILSDLMEKNPRWHDAVLLSYYMDIPQERVAEMMGVRLGVLHSILHRAKVWIRKTYGVEYEEMNRRE